MCQTLLSGHQTVEGVSLKTLIRQLWRYLLYPRRPGAHSLIQRGKRQEEPCYVVSGQSPDLHRKMTLKTGTRDWTQLYCHLERPRVRVPLHIIDLAPPIPPESHLSHQISETKIRRHNQPLQTPLLRLACPTDSIAIQRHSIPNLPGIWLYRKIIPIVQCHPPYLTMAMRVQIVAKRLPIILEQNLLTLPKIYVHLFLPHQSPGTHLAFPHYRYFHVEHTRII
jgi:hypothetical protein